MSSYGYQGFHYQDFRYARVASNPSDNRKESRRVRYDRSLENGDAASYGNLRPRMLLQTNGNRKPIPIKDIPVCTERSCLCKIAITKQYELGRC
jgi:hypothetical protein